MLRRWRFPVSDFLSSQGMRCLRSTLQRGSLTHSHRWAHQPLSVEETWPSIWRSPFSLPLSPGHLTRRASIQPLPLADIPSLPANSFTLLALLTSVCGLLIKRRALLSASPAPAVCPHKEAGWQEAEAGWPSGAGVASGPPCLALRAAPGCWLPCPKRTPLWKGPSQLPSHGLGRWGRGGAVQG